MIEALGRAAVWAALQAPDTVLVRQVATAPTAFEKVTSIASGVLTLIILALAIALIPAAWNFRKSFAKVNALLERFYGDLTPLMHHASAIADNVDYITTSVRTDVQQINATIHAANRRLQDAVAQTESRLRDFNALLRVVQDEAEDAFVSAASTVRGVRRGAEALRDDAGPEFAEDEESYELDEVVDVELGDEDLTELEEELDGDDSEPEPAARPTARPVARPRVRPRGRWRG